MAALLLICSCSDDDNNEGIILGCGNEDIIGISKKEVQFKSETDSVLIITRSDFWQLSEIQLEGSPLRDLAKVDVAAPNFIVEDSAFVVERRNRNEVYITMSENKTDENRKLTVLLQLGNCFDRIIIEQTK